MKNDIKYTSSLACLPDEGVAYIIMSLVCGIMIEVILFSEEEL